MRWTPSYIAFLAYVASIVTQRVQIGTVSMGLAIALLFLERRTIRFPPISLFLVGLILWASLGWAVTDYPAEVADRLNDMAKICAVVFVVANVVVTRQRLRAFIAVMVIAFVIYPLRGSFLNFLYGNTFAGRLVWNGIYSNSNDLAGLCLLQLAIVLGVLEVEGQKWTRMLAFLSALLLPLIILATQSRAVFIALALFVLIVGKRYARNAKKLGLLVVLIATALAFAPDSVWKRINTITSSSDEEATTDEAKISSAQRLEVWKVARAMVADNPLTGVGLGAYARAHGVYARTGRFDALADGERDTHNTYLNLLAETGFVGLGCFVGLVFVTLRESRKTRRRYASSAPSLASQLFLLEIGAYGYLVAAIWGSYGELVTTYLYFALVHVTTVILKSEAITAATPIASAKASRALRTARWVGRARPA